MTGKIKRLLLLNLPYIFIALGATKIGEAWRFSMGLDFAQKVLHLVDGCLLVNIDLVLFRRFIFHQQPP